MKDSRFGLPPDVNDSKIVESAVNEVVAIAKKYLRKPLKELIVLDVGSGHGEYAQKMAKYFGKVVGVEPFREGYMESVKRVTKGKTNLSYVNSKIEDYKSRLKFDLIIHLTVIEHMADAKSGFDRIFTLLDKDGIIFLTAPNKYWIFEQHYGLPFFGLATVTLGQFLFKNV